LEDYKLRVGQGGKLSCPLWGVKIEAFTEGELLVGGETVGLGGGGEVYRNMTQLPVPTGFRPFTFFGEGGGGGRFAGAH